jgi:putative DNA-invertase from lambdoid prophage Rac
MIVLYARVSTNDETTAHQVTQAEAAGFKIDKVLSDEGVSGIATKLSEREQGKRLFDTLRAGDTLVVRWVDRLGRNYTDVVDTIREFMRHGVIIKTVINGMTFDGSTADPMQQAVRDALIAFMAATAQAQAEATKSAQRAGIDHSRTVKPNAYLGRKPSYDRAMFDRIRGAAVLMMAQRKSPRSSAGGPLIPDELLMIDASPSVRVGPCADASGLARASLYSTSRSRERIRRGSAVAL